MNSNTNKHFFKSFYMWSTLSGHTQIHLNLFNCNTNQQNSVALGAVYICVRVCLCVYLFMAYLFCGFTLSYVSSPFMYLFISVFLYIETWSHEVTQAVFKLVISWFEAPNSWDTGKSHSTLLWETGSLKSFPRSLVEQAFTRGISDLESTYGPLYYTSSLKTSTSRNRSCLPRNTQTV